MMAVAWTNIVKTGHPREYGNNEAVLWSQRGSLFTDAEMSTRVVEDDPVRAILDTSLKGNHGATVTDDNRPVYAIPPDNSGLSLVFAGTPQVNDGTEEDPEFPIHWVKTSQWYQLPHMNLTGNWAYMWVGHCHHPLEWIMSIDNAFGVKSGVEILAGKAPGRITAQVTDSGGANSLFLNQNEIAWKAVEATSDNGGFAAFDVGNFGTPGDHGLEVNDYFMLTRHEVNEYNRVHLVSGVVDDVVTTTTPFVAGVTNGLEGRWSYAEGVFLPHIGLLWIRADGNTCTLLVAVQTAERRAISATASAAGGAKTTFTVDRRGAWIGEAAGGAAHPAFFYVASHDVGGYVGYHPIFGTVDNGATVDVTCDVAFAGTGAGTYAITWRRTASGNPQQTTTWQGHDFAGDLSEKPRIGAARHSIQIGQTVANNGLTSATGSAGKVVLTMTSESHPLIDRYTARSTPGASEYCAVQLSGTSSGAWNGLQGLVTNVAGTTVTTDIDDPGGGPVTGGEVRVAHSAAPNPLNGHKDYECFFKDTTLDEINERGGYLATRFNARFGFDWIDLNDPLA